MTAPRAVPLAEVPPQPWRNGGGLTRELLAWPQAADWLVRVSVATVDRAGPFSALPGVRRWFVVLSGAGVRLSLPGGAVRMTAGDPPLAFDGADAPACELLGGPTEDLNLMVRSATAAAAMRAAAPGSVVDGVLRWRGVFAAAQAALEVDGRRVALPAGTLAWDDLAHPARWTLVEGARAYWLTLAAA